MGLSTVLTTLIPCLLALVAAPQAANPRVLITTELGVIEVDVDPVRAPITSANFLRYVDAGLYSGSSFFRVVTMQNQPQSPIKIEVVQGGEVPDEKCFPPIAHETTAMTGLLHVDGAISMARDKPGTATSSFFICVGDQPELDFGGKRNPDGQGFAAFGRVVSGMDVVRRIHQVPSEGQYLKTPVKILSISRKK
jgi:peptidyl-prolyl cis-trans isomerase A (cyclophilin A)